MTAVIAPLDADRELLERAATDHGWEGERDALSLGQYVARQLQASRLAATQQAAPLDSTTPWGCYDCGFMGPRFKTLVQQGGAFEAQCPSCGSGRVDEAATVLRELVATVDELREESAAPESQPAPGA